MKALKKEQLPEGFELRTRGTKSLEFQLCWRAFTRIFSSGQKPENFSWRESWQSESIVKPVFMALSNFKIDVSARNYITWTGSIEFNRTCRLVQDWTKIILD